MKFFEKSCSHGFHAEICFPLLYVHYAAVRRQFLHQNKIMRNVFQIISSCSKMQNMIVWRFANDWYHSDSRNKTFFYKNVTYGFLKDFMNLCIFSLVFLAILKFASEHEYPNSFIYSFPRI